MKENKLSYKADQLLPGDDFTQLNENKNIFQQIFQFSPFSIIVHDMELNILDVNRKAIEEFGYSKSEFLKMRVTDLHTKEELEHSRQVLNTMQQKDSLRVETSFTRKNGSIFYAEATPFKYKIGTKPLIHVYIQNITQRKENEAKLVKAMEKARESDQLKSAFLSNMSHEVRTPMNSILGFVKLLKNPGLNDEKKMEFLNIIERSGDRLLNVIEDIISISSIETGLVEINTELTDINEQLEFIYTFHKTAVENNQLQLILSKPYPAENVIIETDKEKLNAVLNYLIKNAIKYTEKGTIEIGYALKDKQVEFFVKDTGIGIPKQRQTAIFERFVQADVLDRQAKQGSGLGLSLSKSYLKMLGGEIWVESKEGKGSTFYFTLPYYTPQNNAAGIDFKKNTENQSAQEKTRSGLKILIAEDDEFSFSLLKVMLEGMSREVLHAPTGKDAVEIARNNPDIDLILMDIKMPGLTGYEATELIREFNKEVIIVAQTAYARRGDKNKAFDSGCNAYLSKPIKEEELMNLMKTHFTN